MTWQMKEPGHQQPWYWPCYPGIFQFQQQKSLMTVYMYLSWIWIVTGSYWWKHWFKHWFCQATSHYLIHCWPISMLPYGIDHSVSKWVNNYCLALALSISFLLPIDIKSWSYIHDGISPSVLIISHSDYFPLRSRQLPDSPPDSSSEPYSPDNGNQSAMDQSCSK